MPKVKSFIRYPLRFSLAITFLFILLVLISSIVVSTVWLGETHGWYAGSTVGRLVSIFTLLFVLSRFGWISSAGIASLGRSQTWLVLLVPLEYSIVMSAYAMTGSLSFGFSDPVLAGLASVFLMSHAFLEEVAFRGVIMHSLLRAWGNTHRGTLMSVLVSSLFFGGMHIIYLAGEPPSVVFFRIIVAFLLGILFGALVLKSGSIYPAVFFHGWLNVAGYLNLVSSGTAGTTYSWLLLSLFMVPLALSGVYLLRTLDLSFHFLKSPLRTQNPVP